MHELPEPLAEEGAKGRLDSLRIGALFALSHVAWACSPSPPARPSTPEAPGCSDWPSRSGELFVSLDGASKFEVEPFFVARQGDLAIAWEACGCDDLTRVGYIRRDATGGFDKPRYLASPNGQMASNVTLARDGAGSLFATWASWTPGPDPTQPHVRVSDIHIQFARWPASAEEFEAPVELSEPITDSLYDKPWMVLTADDRLVISYSDLRRGGILAVTSADGGASFQRAIVDPTMANLAALCPDGRPGGAFVAYVASGFIRVAHTADGGVTWSPPVAAAVSDPSGNVAFQDPTCIATGDEVWISYGRTLDGYDVPVQRLLGVYVAHLILGASTPDSDVIVLDGADAGQTLSDAGAATGDGGVPPGFLLFPQLARRGDGRLAIAAYRAAGEGGGAADLVSVISADGGRTFGNARTLATGLTPRLQRHVSDWLGDYFGCGPTAGGRGLSVAYVDNTSGFSHIVFDETVP